MSEHTVISSANQLMMQGFSSPSLFIDNAIALETSKMIQKAMASKKRVAIFVTILTIVGIDGIKKVITKFIDLFISWCQDMSWEKLQTGISFLKAITRWFVSFFSFARSVPQKTIVKKDNKESLETVRFATNDIFWKAVMHHPSFSCNLIITKLSICDGTGMMQQDELWMDSKIETPEWTAYLLKTMSFSTQRVKNRREFLENKTGEPIQDLTKITLTEPDETSPYCPNLKENYPRIIKRSDQYFLNCKCHYDNDISLNRLYLLNRIPTELYLIADVVFDLLYEITSFECRMSLKTQIPFKQDKSVCVDNIGMTYLWMYLLQCTYADPHYAGIDHLCNVYILLLMTCISFQHNEVYYSTVFRQTHHMVLVDSISAFNIYIGRDKQTRSEYNIPQTLGNDELDGIKRFVTEHINPKLDANPKIKSLLPLFRHWFITTFKLDGILGYNPEDAKAKAESNDTELSLFIQSKTSTQTSPVELLQSFSTFSKQLIQDYTTQREGSPVAIKYLRIVENTITTKTENPEYKEWKELYAPKTPQNESNSDSNGSSGSKGSEQSSNFPLRGSSDTMFLTYLMKTNGPNSSVPPSPPMYITETTVKREVSVEQVNNSYKNVKTLYLCDQDKKKLFSSLDVFKYKRDLLESLGLPHKLGVLLYGEPGCGKSSAILAIASFLQKDIFYIDLKTVKTNRELKMIFDHVYTLNANGGVIAMEDIDCASNIVLQRKETITGEGTGSDGDNLTLDFLLNLLQGTLTKDGTVFVATTNYIQKLDTALVRDGRFDVKIELKKCNREQLSQMFEIFFGMKLSESLLHRFREFQFIPATILSRMSEYLTSGNVIIPEEVLCPFLTV